MALLSSNVPTRIVVYGKVGKEVERDRKKNKVERLLASIAGQFIVSKKRKKTEKKKKQRMKGMRIEDRR